MLTALAMHLLPSGTLIDFGHNVTDWVKMAVPIFFVLLGNLLVGVAGWRGFLYGVLGHRKGGEHLGNMLIAGFIGAILILGGGFVLHLMISTGQTVSRWGGGMIMPTLIPAFSMMRGFIMLPLLP